MTPTGPAPQPPGRGLSDQDRAGTRSRAVRRPGGSRSQRPGLGGRRPGLGRYRLVRPRARRRLGRRYRWRRPGRTRLRRRARPRRTRLRRRARPGRARFRRRGRWLRSRRYGRRRHRRHRGRPRRYRLRDRRYRGRVRRWRRRCRRLTRFRWQRSGRARRRGLRRHRYGMGRIRNGHRGLRCSTGPLPRRAPCRYEAGMRHAADHARPPDATALVAPAADPLTACRGHLHSGSPPAAAANLRRHRTGVSERTRPPDRTGTT